MVCGDDGKRFKTRSSETVKLIDLLDEAKRKMRDQLQARVEEGKLPVALSYTLYTYYQLTLSLPFISALLLPSFTTGKSPLQGLELDAAAQIIGYGAVKYFDLKQHPSTNYVFSYDR